MDKNILTINSGSSSIKFSMYRMGRCGKSETPVFSGLIERIGAGAGRVRAITPDGLTITDRKGLRLARHEDALKELFHILNDCNLPIGDAIGHRVVHGGRKYRRPHIVNAALLRALRGLIPFAPEHLPHEINAMEACRREYPGIKQIACFDTAFHSTIPETARMYALPWKYYAEGVMKYGFHGLSYEYIISALSKRYGKKTASRRIIIAHLGNGCSMAAIKGGLSVDTSMGFTPAAGLVMSTRTGDIDPGALIYLMKEKGFLPDALNRLINHESGIKGVSGVSSDMRDLLKKARTNKRAAAAAALFAYQAKKYIGAYAAALGGIDTIVFTGGIGENSAEVRGAILSGLDFLGVRIDARKNRANDIMVSAKDSRVEVLVIKTNEELMIARHTLGFTGRAG